MSVGDYAVLIQAGIHWFTALLFNFVSSLTAVVGMFIGVAVSQNTTAANEWILAITAGLFLYIGLTDLVRMTKDEQMNNEHTNKIDKSTPVNLVYGVHVMLYTSLPKTTMQE